MKIFDVYLEDRLKQLDIEIQYLSQRDTFSVFNRLYITCAMNQIEILKTIYPESAVYIESKLTKLIETVYNEFSNTIYLKAEVDFESKVETSGITKEIEIALSNEGLTEEVFTQASDRLELTVALLDYFTARVLGEPNFEIEMGAIVTGTFKQCYEQVNFVANLVVDIRETLIILTGLTDVKCQMTIEASIGLFSYRRFIDMDDLTLGDFDDMPMFEVDYIEIE